MRLIPLLLLLGTFAAADPPAAAPPAGAEARIPMRVDEAVAAALTASPELLDSLDQAALATASLAGTRTLFLPQLSPFFDRTTDQSGASSGSRFGARFSQQFTFGPRVTGSLDVVTGAGASGDGYGASYSLGVEQPLLRGLDPAVTREPLRAAERFAAGQARNVQTSRRLTVVQAWNAYLSVVLQEELVRVASESAARAERIVAAGEAKLAAGTVSRLDALRGQQLLASARSYENDARNARDDAHEALARLTGQPVGTRFAVRSPEGLPVPGPEEEEAVRAARTLREDLVEAKERVTDAEVALRIARSNVLPTLNGFGTVSSSGVADGLLDSLTSQRKASYTLGFRGEASLNQGVLFSQKRQAEIGLAQARRRLEVQAADVERAVRQSARRLRTARQRLAIEAANLGVAEAQLEVANLRYEKGLSDNFHVIDAENLFNTARVAALTSRHLALLAELDLLATSALLSPPDFCPAR